MRTFLCRRAGHKKFGTDGNWSKTGRQFPGNVAKGLDEWPCGIAMGVSHTNRADSSPDGVSCGMAFVAAGQALPALEESGVELPSRRKLM